MKILYELSKHLNVNPLQKIFFSAIINNNADFSFFSMSAECCESILLTHVFVCEHLTGYLRAYHENNCLTPIIVET